MFLVDLLEPKTDLTQKANNVYDLIVITGARGGVKTDEAVRKVIFGQPHLF